MICLSEHRPGDPGRAPFRVSAGLPRNRDAAVIDADIGVAHVFLLSSVFLAVLVDRVRGSCGSREAGPSDRDDHDVVLSVLMLDLIVCFSRTVREPSLMISEIGRNPDKMYAFFME